MSALTIRNIDPAVKERLRVRAAQNGRSMEEEVRVMLKRELKGGLTGAETLKLFRDNFSGENGVELELPPRGGFRAPPNFSEN